VRATAALPWWRGWWWSGAQAERGTPTFRPVTTGIRANTGTFYGDPEPVFVNKVRATAALPWWREWWWSGAPAERGTPTFHPVTTGTSQYRYFLPWSRARICKRGESNSSAPMVEGMVVVWSPGRAGNADLPPSNNRYEPMPVLSN
jgi:hypothetical protein